MAHEDITRRAKGPTVYRGSRGFGRKAMARDKNNQRSGAGLLGEIKQITSKARSMLLRHLTLSRKKVHRFGDYGSEVDIKVRLIDDAGEIAGNGILVKRTFAKPVSHGLLHDIQQIKKDTETLKKKGNDQQALNDSLSSSVAQLQILANATEDIRWRLYDAYTCDIEGMKEL